MAGDAGVLGTGQVGHRGRSWQELPGSAILSLMARVLNWNGKDLPEELRTLPAGQYVVEPVDEVPELTAEEEEGLREAIAELQAGEGESPDEVRRHIDAILRR